MSDVTIVDRAARALWFAEGHTAQDLSMPDSVREKTRAALLAALDPYDTALNAWLCERTNQPARDIQRIVAALHEAVSDKTPGKDD